MKSPFRIISILLLLIGFKCNAQEILIKRSGEQLKVVIIEVNPDDIKFKDWGGQNAVEQVILKSLVHKIKYSDGTEDFFGNLSGKLQPMKETQTPVVKNTNTKEKGTAPKKETEQTAKYSANDEYRSIFYVLGANYMFSTVSAGANGVGLNLGIGYRINESFGVTAAFEPNYLLPKSGAVDVGINLYGAVYPAVIYKIITGIYAYGGVGGLGSYTSKAVSPMSVINGDFGYTGGLMFDVTNLIGLKAGYYNLISGGTSSSATINVGIMKSLNW